MGRTSNTTINLRMSNVFSALNQNYSIGLRPDFTSKLVHVLAFGTPKFYIGPYDNIKHELVNLSSNCDMKSGLSDIIVMYISCT